MNLLEEMKNMRACHVFSSHDSWPSVILKLALTLPNNTLFVTFTLIDVEHGNISSNNYKLMSSICQWRNWMNSGNVRLEFQWNCKPFYGGGVSQLMRATLTGGVLDESKIESQSRNFLFEIEQGPYWVVSLTL